MCVRETGFFELTYPSWVPVDTGYVVSERAKRTPKTVYPCTGTDFQELGTRRADIGCGMTGNSQQ